MADGEVRLAERAVLAALQALLQPAFVHIVDEKVRPRSQLNVFG
jgi:hypothetical protein